MFHSYVKYPEGRWNFVLDYSDTNGKTWRYLMIIQIKAMIVHGVWYDLSKQKTSWGRIHQYLHSELFQSAHDHCCAEVLLSLLVPRQI